MFPKCIGMFASLHRKHLVKIALFVQPQDEVADAQCNQVVMVRALSCSFADYVGNKINGCEYMELASRWERYFGRGNIVRQIDDGIRHTAVDNSLSLIGASTEGVAYGRLVASPRKSTQLIDRYLGARGRPDDESDQTDASACRVRRSFCRFRRKRSSPARRRPGCGAGLPGQLCRQ